MKKLILTICFTISIFICLSCESSVYDRFQEQIFEKNDYVGAIKNLQLFIKENDDPDAFYYLAYCHLCLDNYSDAKINYTKFIEVAEKNNYLLEVAYLDRGVANYELSSFSEAIKDLTKSISYRIDDPTPYLVRAKSFLKLNYYRDACDDFDSYIEYGGEEKNLPSEYNSLCKSY